LYSILIHPKVLKYLQTLKETDRRRLTRALMSLTDTPRGRASKKLAGTLNQWRLRVGDYRILYEVDDDLRTITVYRIRHRKDSYR